MIQSHVIITYTLLTLYRPLLQQIDSFGFASSCITCSSSVDGWSQFSSGRFQCLST